MGLLEDIERGATSFGTTVTHDVDAFIHGAQKNVAVLLNSGINAQGQVTGPLGEHFGRDPMQFTLNMTKHFDKFIRQLVNRVSERTGTAEIEAPITSGKGGTARIKTRVGRNEKTPHLALVMALQAKHHPAALIEEAGRIQQGLPVKRGLDGDYVWYPSMSMNGARGFFGFDEAIAFAGAIAIIVGLIGIAPALISGIMALVGAIGPSLGLGGKPADNGPPPSNGLLGIDGLDPTMAIIIVGVLVVGGWLLLKRPHAAAA